MPKRSIAAFRQRISADELMRTVIKVAQMPQSGYAPLRTVEEDLKTITKAYLSVNDYIASGANPIGASVWLYDNYPFIEEAALSTKYAGRKKEKLPAVNDMPRVQLLLYELARANDGEITLSLLCDALTPFMQYSVLSQGELWQAPRLCYGALLMLCADLAPDIIRVNQARLSALRVASVGSTRESACRQSWMASSRRR
jgi:hypothetical protein